MYNINNNRFTDILVTPLKRLNFSLFTLLSHHPACWLLFQPYIWWAKSKSLAKGQAFEGLVQSDTKLVIDGFQGSANSFTTEVFKRSQTESVKLAHHLHSPAQIIRAIRMNIPVLLNIREPEGAVISLTSRWPRVSVKQALLSYISFYTKLLPYSSDYLILTFDQATQQPELVVKRINSKFNTSFQNSMPKVIEEETKAQVVDPNRESIKKRKREELLLPQNAQLLIHSKELYQKYLNLSKHENIESEDAP
jgi:hypothetical protein